MTPASASSASSLIRGSRLGRSFALSLALAASSLLLAPALAWAGKTDVERFRASIEKDIGKVRKAIESKLDRHRVSKERRAAIKQVVDAEVDEVTQALEAALEDDQLTVRESEQVRFLARHLRGRIKQRLQEEKEQRQKDAPPPPRLGPEKPEKPSREEPKEPKEPKSGAADKPSSDAREGRKEEGGAARKEEGPDRAPSDPAPKPAPAPLAPPSPKPQPGDLPPQPYPLPAPKVGAQ